MNLYGAHISYNEIDRIKDTDLKCCQLMLGKRTTMVCPDNIEEKLFKCEELGVTPVFHAPYPIVAVSDKRCVLNCTKLFIRSLNKQFKSYKEKGGTITELPFVIHAGSTEKQDKEYRERALWAFCLMASTEGSDLQICIENDAGSKNGNKVGKVSFLANVIHHIRGKGYSNIWMTIDTNHAWGNEDVLFDVTYIDNWWLISDVIKVIHLNSIPEKCKRGGHLDRHSVTLIEESGDSVKWLKEVYNLDIRRDFVYYITERDNLDLSLSDYKFLKGE